MKLGAEPAWLSCMSLSLTSVFGRRCCLMYCCVVGTFQRRTVHPQTSPSYKNQDVESAQSNQNKVCQLAVEGVCVCVYVVVVGGGGY